MNYYDLKDAEYWLIRASVEYAHAESEYREACRNYWPVKDQEIAKKRSQDMLYRMSNAAILYYGVACP